MVGLCGIVGETQHDVEEIAHTIEWSSDERNSIYKDDSLQVYTSVRTSSNADQPEPVPERGLQLWIWGDIIGCEGPSGYVPRQRNGRSDARYCAELLESRGTSFIDGLNSEFAGLIRDRDAKEVLLFTDRLGARPIYYTEAVDDCLLFSTNPNTILAHPEFQTSLDRRFFPEYLKFERAFGVHTPFESVVQVHPGSKLTCDLDGNVVSRETYWRPVYRPVKTRYENRVEEFLDIMQRAVEERRVPGNEAGIFVSGGSDSRLLLSLLDEEDVTGIHLNDRMNREAQIAREACSTADVEFRFLQRGPDYLCRVLEKVAEHQVYTSFFDQAHFVGFEDELTAEVDAVFSGHTADTILEGFYMPFHEPTIPVVDWTVPLPVARSIDDVSEYRDYILRSYQYNRGPSSNALPRYLNADATPLELLGEHMHESNGEVVHHGVSFPSLASLAHAGGFYPLTNNKAYLLYYSTVQMMPTHYPYLDNRVIDFSLSVPHRYHARRSVVNRAIARRDDALAAIPKSGIELPLTYPRTVYSITRLWRSFRSKFQSDSSDDASSWSDPGTVLRETELGSEYLFDSDVPKPYPELIDWEVAEALFQDHLEGENNYFDLYGLLSFCNSYPARNGLLHSD